MKLFKLAELIRKEQAISDQIDRELSKWGDGALRIALRAFGAGSLRKNARKLGVSPTYLSQVERGQSKPSRGLLLRVHEVFGLGRTDGNRP